MGSTVLLRPFSLHRLRTSSPYRDRGIVQTIISLSFSPAAMPNLHALLFFRVFFKQGGEDGWPSYSWSWSLRLLILISIGAGANIFCVSANACRFGDRSCR